MIEAADDLTFEQAYANIPKTRMWFHEMSDRDVLTIVREAGGKMDRMIKFHHDLLSELAHDTGESYREEQEEVAHPEFCQLLAARLGFM